MKIAIKKSSMLPHQRQFWESKSFMTLLVGGYGCGKTYIGAMRMLWLSYVNRPYPNLYVSPNYKQAERTIVFTLEDILTRARIPYSYNKSKFELYIPGWQGLIWVASGEKPNSLKGPNIAAAGIDEPFIQKKETFDVVLSRVRENKAAHNELFMTGTPEELNWGYDVAKNEEGMYDIEVINGRTTDNTHLSRQFVTMLENAYDENQVAAYMDGKFINLSTGRVYLYFDRSKDEQEWTPKEGDQVEAGIDFNVDYMTAELFFRRGNVIHFIDEIRMVDADTYALATAIKERYPGITLYPDASGSSRKTSAPKTDHMILRDAKFKVHSPSKNPPVKDRVNAVNNMLRNRRITISKKCKHLIKDLEQLGWKNGDVDKSNIKLTHASDAAGYAISYLFPVKVERDFTKPQPRAWRP
ncbi:hypothetical protein FP507_08740 [Chlorobium phaeovibrioides]|uniref:Terminase large subunit gp17-like C-terminal domain-containing protein n=1 Tax=Chlorobium phaeovibrioides TaxID=1094 RepID=A0A5M8IFB2_CHLPH|nr:terminase family protein [Chlorobium phaeovibrioides]KAA6233115.1 hypothetical protein FP507_08740 [Chlorobium phaeovibrioides]